MMLNLDEGIEPFLLVQKVERGFTHDAIPTGSTIRDVAGLLDIGRLRVRTDVGTRSTEKYHCG